MQDLENFIHKHFFSLKIGKLEDHGNNVYPESS